MPLQADHRDVSVSPPNGSASNGAVRLPEDLQRVVARAKAILAGELQPEVLPLSQAAIARLDREFGDRVPPPTPEAVKRIATWATLCERHRGDGVVVIHTTAGGDMVVLGAGEAEVIALSEGLTHEERGKTLVDHPW